MQNRIAATSFQLKHDSFGRLVVVLPDGASYSGVTPIRGFPISDPDHGLSLCDVEGQEIVWIDDLAQLTLDIRATIELELSRHEFLPEIHRVLSLSMQTDPCEWEVETDRGRTKFLLKNEENVRRLPNNQALIIDAHGIRYLIRNPKSMDRHSQRLLERYL
jgi:hypothetical protein